MTAVSVAFNNRNSPFIPPSVPPLQVFVGVILIPIVGNATEHMTAVSVAYKNRMELAMGIAVGSATQIRWVLALPRSLPFPPSILPGYSLARRSLTC